MTNETVHGSLSPEVQFLPTIFRKIKAGEIRIPAFQRAYVWQKDQIISLLDSIYKGYPVGSILLWQVQQPLLKLASPNDTNFPELELKFPTSYVLDGLQRLTTLYSVFHFSPEMYNKELFEIYFDVRSKKFTYKEFEDVDNSLIVPLNKIFTPKEFFSVQAKVSQTEDGSALVDRLIDLHARFQEYQIPIVTISGRSIEEVVEVFEKINSSGISLSASDFMRAITWSPEFDLDIEIEKISKSAAEIGFEFSEHSIIKMIAIGLEKDPEPESMILLREESVDNLKAGVIKAAQTLRLALEFLVDRTGMRSVQFLPYEGQLLILFKLFHSSSGKLDKQLEAAMEKWFWATSFNEEFRGKPGHYISREIRKLTRATFARDYFCDFKIGFDAEDFLDKRFVSKRAVSGAFALFLGKMRPKSLYTGDEIDLSTIFNDFSRSKFSFLTKEPRSSEPDRTLLSSLSNVILTSDADSRFTSGTFDQLIQSMFAKHGERMSREILRTHLVDAEIISALEAGRTEDALRRRADLIFHVLTEILGI